MLRRIEHAEIREGSARLRPISPFRSGARKVMERLVPIGVDTARTRLRL
jgi:hypothetical protein